MSESLIGQTLAHYRIVDKLGEPDLAIDLLDELLSMSYDYAVTVPLLRLEPVWKPLQDHPRLLALFEKYETEVD